MPPSEWLAASGLADAERFNLGLAVANEIGRDVANGAEREFVSLVRDELERDPSPEHRQALMGWCLLQWAAIVRDRSLSMGMDVDQAHLCALAVFEGCEAMMAEGVQ